jgi:glutamyl-tRNA(Gln) amidotransferase subunit D
MMATTMIEGISEFSKVKVHSSKGVFEGTLLPSKEFLSLKLKSGYNIGIDYKNVERVEKTGEPENRSKVSYDKKEASGKRILIIHTGGTIASRVDYATGAVHPAYDAQEILLQYPQIEGISPIETVQVSNILSEDLRFSHINSMAEALAEAQNNDDIIGIIITHGTDTMHYTASGLTFMLSHFRKPVIITGSQRSSDRPSSDSMINLLSSAIAITKYADLELEPGLFVCMHHNIEDEKAVLIEGLFARKEHSSRRDAFKSINKPYAATIDPAKGVVDRNPMYKQYNYSNNGKVTCTPLKEELRIGILKSHPNMHHDDIMMYKKHDGLIIEGTGFGHVGVSESIEENNGVYEAIIRMARKMPVFMSKQAVSGMTSLTVYSAGRRLQKAGVIGDGTDCTPECAFMKLAHLLSSHTKKEAKKLMMQNIRGEYNDYREVA